MFSRSSLAIMAAACGLSALGQAALAQNLQDRIDHVMQRRAAAQAQNSSKPALLGALLYTDISVQFQENTARDAINHIATVLGINIVGRYSDDRTGLGLDPEAPITLNVVNKPALSVLEMVIDQAAGDEDATWQLRDGYVEVGTKERLASRNAQEIKYYSIKDLLFVAPQFNNAPRLDLNNALNQGQNQGGGGGGRGGGGGGGGGSGGQQGSILSPGQPEEPRLTEAERAQQIIDLITETIEPEGWDVAGGTWATIRYYQGTLIIKAPDFIHRQIGGYPFAIRPVGANPNAQARNSRYVMFTGGMSEVTLVDVNTVPFTGAAGGTGFGGGAGGGGAAGNAPPANKP